MKKRFNIGLTDTLLACITYFLIAFTVLFSSCIDDVSKEDDDDSNNGKGKSTVSFKAGGREFNLSRNSDDNKGDFPSFLVTNSPHEGLIVQFSPDGKIIFEFAGEYLANTSQDYKEGGMSYVDLHQIGTVAGQGYNAYSWDKCSSDSFSFQIQKQNAGMDYMPQAARFTGTFKGSLVYYHGKDNHPNGFDDCGNPEFLQITDGKFSVIGLNY